MAVTLTWEKVSPFLSPRAGAQQTRVEPWLAPLQVLLNARYGDRITTEPDGGNESLFVSAAADAINRRVTRPADFDHVQQQSIGPASARYRDRAGLAGWFTADDLAQLDDVTGRGTVRTYRTPAPDGQRFGNVSRESPATVDESLEGDVVL